MLDDVIFEHLIPAEISKGNPAPVRIKELNRLIREGKEAALRGIRKRMRMFVAEADHAAYIAQQQVSITVMLDALLQIPGNADLLHLKINNSKHSLKQLFANAMLELETLFNELWKSYHSYFDEGGTVPGIIKQREATQILAERNEIEKMLNQATAPKEFVDMLNEPADYFLRGDTTSTFRDMHYLQELQRKVLDVLRRKDENVITAITDRLFYLNFNSVWFYNYAVQQLEENAASKQDAADFYAWEMKIINQKAVKPSVSYLQNMEGIRDQLTYWIAEELHYLNKKKIPVQTSVAPISAARDKSKKVHVNLTVPDLALGARLLLDDVIVNSGYKEIMDIIAKHFRTNRRESLSNNNTYNEGFNISLVTKEKMKGLLLRLQRKVGEF